MTDNGTEFMGEFKHLLTNCNITHHLTSVYHPQGNGQAERVVQTIKSGLTKMCAGNGGSWDQHLPLLVLAYNSSPHAVTKLCPSELLYGKKFTLPVAVSAFTIYDIIADSGTGDS